MHYAGKFTRSPLRIAGSIAVIVIAFGGVTMLLWNWLVPPIFDGPYITFLQALGLLALAKILLSHGRPWGRWGHYGWRERIREHMQEEHPGEGDAPAPEQTD